MLIFVQVYRTIDKVLISYKVLKEQMRANESTILKLEASEEKCSWSDDVIRSKFVRSISSEEISPEVEVHQKMRDLKLQRLFNRKSVAAVVVKEFESIGCLFSQERWQRTIVQTVQPLPSLLCSCLCIKTRIIVMPAVMFLQTRNAFEIDSS